MNKFGKISLITTGALVALVGGAILFNTVPSLKNKVLNNNAHIGVGNDTIGDITVNTETTSKEYLALINQYSAKIESLQTELNNTKSEYEKNVNQMQSEINTLQLELENTTEENADIIEEKNARIQVLKDYIQTMQSEQAETNSSYEEQIGELNKLLASYEKEIIATIKLPSDFTFTGLGFKVIENDDFIFYSTSHSCKLYYYHFETKTLETIPIKGTSFDSFYKDKNSLYFRTSKICYVYSFTDKTLDILGSANGIMTYLPTESKMYMFDYSGGYAVHDLLTGSFTNFLGDGAESSNVTVKKQDNFILHTAYSVSPNNTSKHYNIQCYNTETGVDMVLFDTSYTLNAFVKTSHGYYICMSTGLYKLNIEDCSVTLIQDLEYSYGYATVLEDKVVVFGYKKAYIYDGNNVTELLSYEGSSVNPEYIKISNGIYYVLSRASSFKGVWKLDINNNSLVEISSAYYGYADRTTIGHYEFVSMQTGIYIIDLNTGSVDTMSSYSQQSTPYFKTMNFENYTIFYLQSVNSKSSYVYFYDHINDVYGKIFKSNGFAIYGCEIKKNMLFIMTDTYLYGFDLTTSLDNYVIYLTINTSLSNIEAGVFYTVAGTLEDGKLYIKYILQEDNSFKKELVII